MSASQIIIVLVIGLAAGVLSGSIGVGGGILIVPALVYFLNMSQHVAQGTSLALMLPPVGILAVYKYYKEGNVDFKVALLLMVMFVVGGYFGAHIANLLPKETLKKVFGAILLLISIKMILGK